MVRSSYVSGPTECNTTPLHNVAEATSAAPTPLPVLPELTPGLFEMVAFGLISEDEARRMLQSTTDVTNAESNGAPPTPPLQPDQPIIPPMPPPPQRDQPVDQIHRPILPPRPPPIALTADLFEMVATGVMTEDEARQIMQLDVRVAESNALPPPSLPQPDPSIASPTLPRPPPPPPIPPPPATASLPQTRTDHDPIPPSTLPPLTADLLEMVRNGVMSEQEAYRMMGSPGTHAAMAACLAEADEKVCHACIFENILFEQNNVLALTNCPHSKPYMQGQWTMFLYQVGKSQPQLVKLDCVHKVLSQHNMNHLCVCVHQIWIAIGQRSRGSS